MDRDKVVGILGGMGPFATIDFFRLIVENTPAEKDWEHLRILIDNHVKLPSRTRAVLYGEESPTPGMVESINNLARVGADFVVVPCNSAHFFYDEVVRHIDIPWISIIEVTSSKIRSLNKQHPLILGGYVTTSNRLYTQYISGSVYLDPDDNRMIERMIEEIKLTCKLSTQSQTTLQRIIEAKSQVIDSVVLACTELPIIYSGLSLYGVEIINSSMEYAKETISYAKNTIQSTIPSSQAR